MGNFQAQIAIALLLINAGLVFSEEECKPEAPGNCYDNGTTTCNNWTLNNWEEETGSQYKFLEFKGNATNTNASLVSDIVCATGESAHCLRFDFRTTNDVNNYGLQVLQTVDSGSSESIWNVSGIPKTWTTVNVFVAPTRSDFSLTIQAIRHSDDKNIRLDEIFYLKNPCPPEPTTLSPTTTTPTTTTTTTKTPPPATTSVNLKLTPESTDSSTTSSSQGDDAAMSASDLSSNTGIIAGAVAAAAVVVIAVVIVVVLYKRNGLFFWKSCFRKKPRPEHLTSVASHNPAYSNADDNDNVMHSSSDLGPLVNSGDKNAATNYFESHNLGAAASSDQSPPRTDDNDYSVIKTKEDEDAYSQANEFASSDSDAVDYSVAHVFPASSEAVSAKLKESEDHYNSLHFASNDPGAETSRDVYNHLKGTDNETEDNYNSLAFDGKPGPSSEPPTDVYNHLDGQNTQNPKTSGSTSTGNDEYKAHGKTTTGSEESEKAPTYSNMAATSAYELATQSSKATTEANDDYNRLDFDRKEKEVQRYTDDDVSGVYSHVTEGEEDAYNELNRHRRGPDVIDDVYSHLQ